jgi:alanyl-tRNA synthetase
VEVVKTVIEAYSPQYPDLKQRATHLMDTTRAEEERFLATIDGGMTRFESLAPLHTSQGGNEIRGTISGEDAFKLYDTYGFPIDLTELMARERGYLVDIPGFERALDAQRTQSKDERKAKKVELSADELSDIERWERDDASTDVQFVGYDSVEVDTSVAAIRRLSDGRVAVMLRETPFYAESGGQISDRGEIVGDGWRVDVDEVRKVDGRIAAVGRLTGELRFGAARARVPSDRRRDTERNHTATHLLHAALRSVLGEHVHQAGSLVAPDRLRFDFTNHGPVPADALEKIEKLVNQWIWAGVDVGFKEMRHADAVQQGAMALFGEKYGDVVRVVSVPGFSVELCGGTHVRNTAQIGLFTIISETGVAAGVRRIEAATSQRAFEMLREHDRILLRMAEQLRAPVESVDKRLQAVLDERRTLEKRLQEAQRGGGDQVSSLIAGAQSINGTRLVASPVNAADIEELKTLGDALRDKLGSGVGVVSGSFADSKHALLVVVTDDLRDKGVRADVIVRELAAVGGGKGGGKPHMAQAGIPDGGKLPEILRQAESIVRPHVERSQ